MEQPPRAHRIALTAGQTCRMHLHAGRVLVVLDGAVWLDGPPQLLAGLPYRPRQRLASGAIHRLDCAGWLQLEVDGPEALVVVTSADGWRARLPDRLRALTDRLRRTCARRETET